MEAKKGTLELVDKVVHHPAVKDEDVALGGTFLLVEPVGDSGSGWLVDDPEHIEAVDDTSVLGGLMLRVVEVGGYSHHSILQVVTEIGLSSFLLLLQDKLKPGLERQVIRGFSWPELPDSKP